MLFVILGRYPNAHKLLPAGPSRTQKSRSLALLGTLSVHHCAPHPSTPLPVDPPVPGEPPEAPLPPTWAEPPEAPLPPTWAEPPEALVPPAWAEPPEALVPPAWAEPPEALVPP